MKLFSDLTDRPRETRDPETLDTGGGGAKMNYINHPEKTPSEESFSTKHG